MTDDRPSPAEGHLRVGTFQYAASLRDGQDVARRLADYAIARHHPEAAQAQHPHLALFDAVCAAQARLVAQWMLVGFVHGVMNTDNMTISGETIDYGPCAFLEAYDPATVFSSIDQGGRYAYGNQPLIARWNLARPCSICASLCPLGGVRRVQCARSDEVAKRKGPENGRLHDQCEWVRCLLSERRQ